MENPPKKWFRLKPGGGVRLKHAYFIKCEEVVKDGDGNVIELRCTYDPDSRGGQSPDGRKVRGTLHWVSAEHAVNAEVRLYDHLFSADVPGERTGNYLDDLNPDSLEILTGCKVEPGLAGSRPGMTRNPSTSLLHESARATGSKVQGQWRTRQERPTTPPNQIPGCAGPVRKHRWLPP